MSLFWLLWSFTMRGVRTTRDFLFHHLLFKPLARIPVKSGFLATYVPNQ